MMLREIQMHKIDVQEFMEAVDRCKGNVYLVTRDGDRLNLKSKLCQLLGITNIIEGGQINEATVICELPEDETMLFRYNLYGKLGA